MDAVQTRTEAQRAATVDGSLAEEILRAGAAAPQRTRTPAAWIQRIRSAPAPEVRWWSVVVPAALGVLVTTAGPSTLIAFHWLHDDGGWTAWMWFYPFAAVALGGTWALVRALRTVSWRDVPWPLWAIGAFVLLALLSAFWTVSPNVTPLHATLGVGIAAFACWFGLRLTLHEQTWSVVIATSAATVASALLLLFETDLALMEPSPSRVRGAWRGIFANRNSLAPVCVLGLLALVGLVLSRPSARRFALALPLAAVDVVLLRNSAGSTSSMALVLMAIAAAGVPLLWGLRRLRVPGWALVALAPVALVGLWIWVFERLDSLATTANRDSSLTGRREIWEDVRGMIADRRWFGHGYWGVWDNAELTRASYLRLGSAYGSAHDSLLEVALMLGFVGVAVYLAIAGAAIAGVFSWAWQRPSVASWWWTVLLVFLVGHNLLESFVLWHSYNWMLFLAAAVVPFGVAGAQSGLSRRSESATASPSTMHPGRDTSRVSP